MKEENAIILEYLPNGYPLEKKMMPLAQAVGEKAFTLFELVPKKGVQLEAGEKVYIGQGKRDKIYYILGKLHKEKLTESARQQLEEVIRRKVKERELEFLDFFNKAEAINKRIHQIELLPGIGKKHMQEILHQREEKKFESFEDLKRRIPNLPDPQKAIERRILKEIIEDERHHLFVKSN